MTLTIKSLSDSRVARSGFLTTVVAMTVGLVVVLLLSFPLRDYPPLTREPLIQGVAMVAAWLTTWPWMARQNGWLIRQAGFVGFVIWIVVGMLGIAAARIYLQTG